MRFAPLALLVVAALPAWAAEPPAKADKAEKSDATSCDSYGDNFYLVPGSSVCVAAGAIAELTGQASRLSSGYRQNQLVFHGALAADARTDTGWGELRGFTRVSYYSDSHTWTPDYLFVSLTGTNDVGQIGITDSTFNYLGSGPSVGTLRSANLSAKMVRYAHTIVPGLTAKISLEVDPNQRPRNVADPLSQIAPAAVPGMTTTDRTQPDLVAALAYEPTAGSVQLSAALHRVQSPRAGIPDQAGFAVQFGMTLPLDFTPPAKDDASATDDSDDDDSDDDSDTAQDDTAKGDTAKDNTTKDAKAKGKPAKAAAPAKTWDITHSFAWQIAYAKGATLYLGYGTGPFSKAAVDAVILPDGTMQLISGVTAMAYYTIGWLPKVSQNIFGSWSQLSPPSAAVGFNLQGSRDYREARIGTNFVYEPWKDFTITLEAMAMCADLAGIRNGTATQLAVGTTAYQFSLQVSKTF